MRRRRRPLKVNQPDLFSPPPMIPTWPSLTPATQQQLRSLLTKMLQNYCTRLASTTPPKGVRHE